MSLPKHWLVSFACWSRACVDKYRHWPYLQRGGGVLGKSPGVPKQWRHEVTWLPPSSPSPRPSLTQEAVPNTRVVENRRTTRTLSATGGWKPHQNQGELLLYKYYYLWPVPFAWTAPNPVLFNTGTRSKNLKTSGHPVDLTYVHLTWFDIRSNWLIWHLVHLYQVGSNFSQKFV